MHSETIIHDIVRLEPQVEWLPDVERRAFRVIATDAAGNRFRFAMFGPVGDEDAFGRAIVSCSRTLSMLAAELDIDLAFADGDTATCGDAPAS